jgi:glutamate-1-semialdehyde aminotransferase
MRYLRMAALPVAVLLAVATTQCARQSDDNTARVVEGLPAGISLTDAKQVEIQDGGGQVVLSGTFLDNKAQLASTGTDAKGVAEIEIEKEGNELEQEIKVAVENLPPSASFKLLVDGQEVATFSTSGDGKKTLKFTRKDSNS